MKRFDPVTQARIDLTAALRSAARMGLNEGVCNHFSLEMPGDPTKFLINPQGLHWSELTPADMMVVDENGKVVEGKHQVEPTAFFIHGRIHLGKRKKAVLHTHMPFATSLTLLDGGELDVFANQSAMRYYGRIGYDREYGGVALANEEGDRICNALGDNSVVFMQHHGVIVCGDNIAYAFDDLYYLERCWCRCWRTAPAENSSTSRRRWLPKWRSRSKASASSRRCISRRSSASSIAASRAGLT